MTIINFVQNNYTNRQGNSNAALEADLLNRLLSGWVSHLAHVHRQTGKELALLQAGTAPGEREKSLAELARLQEETALGLERLETLLKKEAGNSSAHQPTPPLPDAHAWIWLSLQYFFESWNPETADFQLWTLMRPVFSGERQSSEQEREEAASYYELSKLLIDAAWALHRQQAKTLPLS